MNNIFKDLEVISSIDGSKEKNLFYYPEGAEQVPMVVGLHTWSFDRHNQQELIDLCVKRGWALLLPEFRGPNKVENPRAPEACGSKIAKQDVIDAIDYVCANYPIDSQHIFLFGGSGGGHMALMLAAYRPELWTGVSAWCPITDLIKWHEYYGVGQKYALHLEGCCGGAPGNSVEVDLEYKTRSPISYLNKLLKAKLSIHHGRADSSVPYSHTLELAMQLETMGHEQLFFEIFDGGHEMRSDVAFHWFDTLHHAAKQQELTG